MRLTVFLVNTICRPVNALFALADRDVCRWVELTDEDES
jgi:hypothetical protein